MPRPTADQVKALAPDPASFTAGKGLSDARKWKTVGANDAALWGECQGSGKDPYKVRVDLVNAGYACTCPSRKFPCKHAIGLMLLAANPSAKLTESNPPDWVAEWLEKRATRQQAPAKKAESKPDEASRQKDAARRAAKREKLADTGIDSLERWLKDIVKQGLAAVPSLPSSFWAEQSARMVDSQLPGAARIIRELGEMPKAGNEWGERFLLKLSRLYLLIQAYRKIDTLPVEAQADVRTLLGWTVNQDELQAAKGISDDWLVLSQTTEEDDSTGIRTQVNWLWGRESKRPALIFNFAHRTQPMDMSLAAGLCLRGELVYFPGAWPLRAVFKERKPLEKAFVPAGYATITDFLTAYSDALAANPWLEQFPLVFEAVTPVKLNETYFVKDSQNQTLPLSRQFSAFWEILALSGGLPIKIFGLWDGFSFLPLSAWENDRFLAL